MKYIFETIHLRLLFFLCGYVWDVWHLFPPPYLHPWRQCQRSLPGEKYIRKILFNDFGGFGVPNGPPTHPIPGVNVKVPIRGEQMCKTIIVN